MPEPDLAHVFDVSWRDSSAPHAGVLTHGAGLGLAFVRGIVAAHRGQVSVCNVDGGCGFERVLDATGTGRRRRD